MNLAEPVEEEKRRETCLNISCFWPSVPELMLNLESEKPNYVTVINAAMVLQNPGQYISSDNESADRAKPFAFLK
jgi:hypothetical protein